MMRWLAIAGLALAMDPLGVDAGPANLRELCRGEIAGMYISTYDELRLAGDRTVALGEQYARLAVARDKAHKEVENLRRQLGQTEFDATLTHALLEAESTLEMIDHRYREQEGLLEESRRQLRIAELHEKQVRKKLEGFATITQVTDDGTDPYPYVVDFKSPCPKYRFLCPLDENDRGRVRKFLEQVGSTENCRRFVQMN